MKTFYLLYVIIGGGAWNSAWGGPALMRFETLPECEAALRVVKTRSSVSDIACLPVTVAMVPASK
jgi:hypothetical protein